MEPEQKSNGALVGSVIIVIILIIGGIYLWKTSLEDRNTDSSGLPAEVQGEDAAQLEAELESMEFESLDEEI